MRPSRLLAHLAVLVVMLAPQLAGASEHLAQVEVYDRTAGRLLPIHFHEGRMYVAGEPQHQYELRLRNSSRSRVLAVTSVDGVNVISGKTAGTHQGGYVMGAWDSVAIEGWRKNLDEVATFYFTSLGNSYAARTGRPNNVGVIGVALFREQAACCDDYLSDSGPSDERARAAAPSASTAQTAEAEAAHQRREKSKLGTGHGHRESSVARYVDFRRASPTPDETITIYYDSRKNLVAQGVLPPTRHYARNDPDPFPEGFAPDP